MAVRLTNGQVVPFHKGEYCGNHNPAQDAKIQRLLELTTKQNFIKGDYEESEKRHGIPQSCGFGTSAEMSERGYVGLYLLEDKNSTPEGEICETPPELMEPGREHEYNTDGVPGLCDDEILSFAVEA